MIEITKFILNLLYILLNDKFLDSTLSTLASVVRALGYNYFITTTESTYDLFDYVFQITSDPRQLP